MRQDYYEITYPTRIRIVAILVILFITITFYSCQKIEAQSIKNQKRKTTKMEEVEFFQIELQQQNFQSARPSIPIEADEDSEIDTLEFMDTDISDFGFWEAPPLSGKKRPLWVAYDKAPVPKKTLRPKYPDFCKQAGIEGTVIVSFWVDEKGIVDPASVEILQSVPCLDQHVINIIKKSKWRPARQGRQKVGVPLSMPFNFKLRD